MERRRESWGAAGLAVLMIICCLAGPLIVGAVGALTAGAMFGVGAAILLLLALCLFAALRLTSDRRC